MTFQVTFFKDRQKFSAAHFTLFEDGELERLHGHNYVVSASFFGNNTSSGLLFPFHQVKPVINSLCNQLDERVLLPTQSPMVTLTCTDIQTEVKVDTPFHQKFYSFPTEDCILLDCNNISCENLVVYLTDQLTAQLKPKNLPLTAMEVAVSESSGQTVALRRDWT